MQALIKIFLHCALQAFKIKVLSGKHGIIIDGVFTIFIDDGLVSFLVKPSFEYFKSAWGIVAYILL